jgi:type II secretory pathway pseudopilin PulG
VRQKEKAVMASHSASGRYRHHQQGFTYLGVLIAIAIMGIGLLAVSEVWTTNAERQKMAELDWIGQQYVQGIESYYYANTGSVHYYPASLEDLVEDKRYLIMKRHIRVMYPNPYTQKVQWKTLAAPGGGIRGIAFSRDESAYPVHREFAFMPPVGGS